VIVPTYTPLFPITRTFTVFQANFSVFNFSRSCKTMDEASINLANALGLSSPTPFSELIVTNSKLVTAKCDSDKTILYSRRSGMYLLLKQYQHALNNIQLAIDHCHSDKILQKLRDRLSSTKKLMELPNPEDDPWNFFKLSHPPHPRIPFISDCLEIRKSQNLGRGIYTNRDLQPGDVISVEEVFMPYQTFQSTSAIERCFNCLGSNMLDLLPCLETFFYGKMNDSYRKSS
jgi:hypothetical protein